MRAIALILLLSAPGLFAAEPPPIHKLSAIELNVRLLSDARAVQLERKGLRDVIEYVRSHPDLFPAESPKSPRLLRREEKETVWRAWQRFLDYVVALEGVEKYHAFH